tara:strand:- start:648 stop:755 length:108 start_codon:yes stop_codon:yes gene_type:complete
MLFSKHRDGENTLSEPIGWQQICARLMGEVASIAM